MAEYSNNEWINLYYLTLFGRPVDYEGFLYWNSQLANGVSVEEVSGHVIHIAYEQYASEGGDDFASYFINNLYLNLFNREVDEDGLAYWKGELEAGTVTHENLAQTIIWVASQASAESNNYDDKLTMENKLAAAQLATEQMLDQELVWNDNLEAYLKALIAGIGSDSDTLNQGLNDLNGYFELTDTFTLKEVYVEETVYTPEIIDVDPYVTTVTYWGYNPDDGGVPLSEVIHLIETYAGLDFVELGLINVTNDLPEDTAQFPDIFSQLTNLEIELEDIDTELDPAGNAIALISVTLMDGTVHTAEVEIAQMYFDFIHDLLYNEDGSTRLFEREITVFPQVALRDADGNIVYDVDGNPIRIELTQWVNVGQETVFTSVPIVLTPTQNNGGTVESGFTTDSNDTIVAGRLELLHQAYIDGGKGFDTLDIHAKGYFAQPLGIFNVEHVNIQNLPNVYTTWGPIDNFLKGLDLEEMDLNDLLGNIIPIVNSVLEAINYDVSAGTTYPDLRPDLIAALQDILQPHNLNPLVDAILDNLSFANTVIDLSTTRDIESLTVTEGNFHGLSFLHLTDPGTLTITGIRNGAETTLDGGFSQDVTLNYSDTQGVGVDLVFNNVDFQPGARLIVAHNSDTLNIESTGGGNTIESGDFGGQVSTINITGDARLFIASDIGRSLHMENPIVIDASENTAGVNLNLSGPKNVTFYGSRGDDLFSADTDGSDYESVTIEDLYGNNVYDVGTDILAITNGDGNNTYFVDADSASVTAGDGNNHFEGSATQLALDFGAGDNLVGAAAVDFTANVGDGDNRIVVDAMLSKSGTLALDPGASVDIVAGDGANSIVIFADAAGNGGGAPWLFPASINIVAGDGGNDIYIPMLQPSPATSVDIQTGTGQDDIFVSGIDITIDSGGGGDVITLIGTDRDYTPSDFTYEGRESDYYGYEDDYYDGKLEGAFIDIDTGTGSATIILGDGHDTLDPAAEYGPKSITAKEGSSITGEDITLFVNTGADLRAAELSGVTKVVLDDDFNSYQSSPTAFDTTIGDGDGSHDQGECLTSLLVLTDEQFMQIGAENFAVEGSMFHTYAQVKIIVTGEGAPTTTFDGVEYKDVNLSDLGVDALSKNIDLILEIQDGVQLTMTAEQLHTKVAPQGVKLADDGNFDYSSGRVQITDAGATFDPFNVTDQLRTEIDGQPYYGGSLSNDFWEDLDADGVIERSEWLENVGIDRSGTGYNRVTDTFSYDRFTIDTGEVSGEYEYFSTISNFLRIVGDEGITFTPIERHIDEYGRLIEGQSSIELGIDNGEPTNTYVVDFSGVGGEVVNLTLGNFEMIEAIAGNGTSQSPARVNVELGGDVASAEEGLISWGVQTYVVTDIHTEDQAADFYVCETTHDLETLGLQGNYYGTINFKEVDHGVTFLMEAEYEKSVGDYAVGTLTAEFASSGASTVVDIEAVTGGTHDVEQIIVAGIDIDNADSITINADGPAVIIGSFDGNNVEMLDVNADGDVTIEGDLPTTLTSIDASDVVGTFIATIDGNPTGNSNDYIGSFSFVGSQGGSVLYLEDLPGDGPNGDVGTYDIDGGIGGVDLVILEDTTDPIVDLSESTLNNVDTVTLENGANLTLTVAQATDIGATNFFLADEDSATLTLEGLDGELFVVPDFDEDITINLVSLADMPVVTLHPDTDLTGINALIVNEGTTLELSAEQFMQLGEGPLGGGQISGGGSVHITGLTQEDVGEFGEDFDLDSVTVAGTVTITLAESVDLSQADLWYGFNYFFGTPSVDVFNVGDDMTLTLGDLYNADGVVIDGGENSVLKFTDTWFDPSGSIDASGFNVDELMVLNLLVANRNVDLMFYGLPTGEDGVEKVFYDDLGWVDGVDQFVVLEEGATVEGFIVFNKPEEDVEIRNFTLTMEGGSWIKGNLVLTASDNEDGLPQMDLQSVTINSLATADDPATDDIVEGANRYSGETANIISGDITSQATVNLPPSAGYDPVDNDLLNVTINAEEDFILEGSIIFESVVGNDDVTANDDDEATATLNVTGEADVTIGDLDTDDDDVDYLVINHNGTGGLTVGLSESEATVDPDDLITFNGDAVGRDTIIVSGQLDLSDDILVNIDEILLNQNANLTLTFDQYESLAGILDLNEGADAATISIVGLDNGDVFDATALPEGITVASITMAEGDITLDPATNLTGVGEIIVPEGGTLNLTAEQFAQLAGEGKITVLDTDDNPDNDAANVNIIGLTQAIVDSGVEDPVNGGFDITQIDEDIELTVTLGEDRVNLGTYDEDGDLVYAADLDADGIFNDPDATFILADGQTLAVVNGAQANGLVVESESSLDVADTTLIYMFTNPGPFGNSFDCSGYDVSTLKILSVFVGGRNVESLLSEVDSDVTIQVYHNPAELGFLDPTYRVFVVEESVTINGLVMFNDPDTDDEVLTLTLTMLGGVEINGDILLSTFDNKDETPLYFQTLTINSEGTAENLLSGETANIIKGSIDPDGGLFTTENNLLDVVINATQVLEIQGDLEFDSNSMDPDGEASLLISDMSTADVFIGQIDVLDDEVVSLTVANEGTGTLYVLGGSPAIDADGNENFETLVFDGAGDIVLGDHDPATDATGIDAPSLSLIDASSMEGDLDLGEIEDIDSDSFEFISGSGVTTMTLTTDTLDSTGVDMTPDTDDDGIGWNFDFTLADVGSEFHLGGGLTFVDGSILNIDLGANTTLYIDASMDLSGLDLSIIQTLDIVLGDEVTLTLTAAQANALNIVAGDDTDNDGDFGIVNIVGLGDDPVDLSGIADDIAGYVYLEDDDVSLDAATDLGGFTVALIANGPEDYNPGGGQTIRFSDNTDKQADGRDIIVVESAYVHGTDPDLWDVPGDDGNNTNTTNVAWLFDTIPGQLDTTGYDANIGRLWVSAALIDSVGGDVENLFNWLPDSILRVDFNSVTELDIFLASYATDRVIELTSFTTIVGLTEIDDDILPQEEHIETLRIAMGGEVTVGDIVIGDVVAAPDTDPLTPEFEALYLNSRVALHDAHYLATEDYVNDNDGVDEPGEHVEPAMVNTVGDISVGGANPLIDMLDVYVNTYGAAIPGGGTQTPGTYPIGSAFGGDDGADLVAGTLTFDSEVAGETATLFVTGVNDVTFKSVDTSDPEITAYVLNTVLHVGTYTVTGGSPAMDMDDTESFTINTGTYPFSGQPENGIVNFGTAMDTVNGVPYAGVAGDDLSSIVINGNGEVNLGVLAEIDGTDDLAEDINGDGDTSDLNEGANIAFTLDGNGNTTATLGAANVDGSVVAPMLEAGSTWRFEDVELTITEDAVFQAGATLELHNVELYIQGDVDLTMLLDDPLTPEEEGLDISGTTIIYVPEGQSLTLTVEQLKELDMVDIRGEGTVFIVGDASDYNALGTHMRVVNVDYSAVTIDTDGDGRIYYYANTDGAIDDDGNPIGFNIIGSEFADDYINDFHLSEEDDTIYGGSGDDWMSGQGGNDTMIGGPGDDSLWDYADDVETVDTYIVDEGTDHVRTLDENDILLVYAGATANVDVGVEFVATTETVNDGTANLTAYHSADTVIDLTLAGGANGFAITGNTGADTLIGSQKADTINGGDNTPGGDNDGEEDELTGNGGDDLFVFNISVGTPADMAPTETVAPEDEETLTVNDAEASDIADVGFTINYSFNGVGSSVAVAAGDVDVSDADAIASAIATAIDGLNGVVATATTNVVTANTEDGNSFEFLGVTVTGTPTNLASGDFSIGEGTDVPEQTEVVFSGAVAEGDIYTVLITLADGQNIGASYEAQAGDSLVEIANGLATEFNIVAPATTVNALSDGVDTITFTDEYADNGGFTLIATPQGSIDGTGASSLLVGTETTLDEADADVITDFTTGEDQISLGITDGTFGNYFEDAGQVDFTAALAEANNQFDGSTIYYLTFTPTDEGLLFFDANADGDADGVLQLLGVDNTGFDYTDIIA